MVYAGLGSGRDYRRFQAVMVCNRLRISIFLLVGVVVVARAMTSGWVGSDANSQPVVTPEPMTPGSASIPSSIAGPLPVPTVATVYQYTDSLAFRELVESPTEHVDL